MSLYRHNHAVAIVLRSQMIACIGRNQAVEPGRTRRPDSSCLRLLPETKGKRSDHAVISVSKA